MTSVLGVLGQAFDVAAKPKDFEASLAGYLSMARQSIARLMPWLDDLYDEYVTIIDGVENNALDKAGAIAEKLGPIFDLFNLGKLFDDMTQKQDPEKDFGRFSFETVVDRLIEQMRTASEKLKVALPEIGEIWGDALDASVTLAEKIAGLFGNIADAMGAAQTIADSRGLKPQSVLDALDIFTQMVTGIQTVGGFSGLAVAGAGAGGVASVPGATFGDPNAMAGLDWHGLDKAGRASGSGPEHTLNIILRDEGGHELKRLSMRLDAVESTAEDLYVDKALGGGEL